jgi:hypothetical protein
VNWALETLYLEENAVVENGQGALALQNVLRSTFRLRSEKKTRKRKKEKRKKWGKWEGRTSPAECHAEYFSPQVRQRKEKRRKKNKESVENVKGDHIH